MRCWLKFGRSFFLTLISVTYLVSCSSDSDPGPQEGDNFFVVDGTTFTPTSTQVINTGAGFLIELEDDNYKISLLLSDSVSGDYGIIPANQIVYYLEKMAMAYWTDNSGNVFYGDAGAVSISAGNNKVSGTFYAVGKDLNDKASFINNGAITNIEVVAPESDHCLLSTMKINYPGGSLPNITTNTYGYDKGGRLVKRVEQVPQQSVPNVYYYFWQNDRITRELRHRLFEQAGIATWNYEDDKLISVVTQNYEDGYFKNRTDLNFEYTGDRVTKLTSLLDWQPQVSYFIQYTGSNVSTVSYVDPISAVITITYSGYDNKNAPFLLLAQAMNTSFNPDQFGWSSATFPAVFSANNFGGLQETSNPGGSGQGATVVYPAYNAAGYPLEFTLHLTSDVTSITSFTYINCGS